MILRQLAEGRCEVENQYTRVVPYEGNLRALRGHGRGLRAAPALRVARARASSPRAALRLSDAYADFDAELRFSVPGVRVADPKACQCGEVLKGVIKPWECKVFGTACTPERPIGTCMVSPRGRLRGLLQLRPLRAGAGRWCRAPRRRLRARGSGSSGSSRPRAPSARSSATSASRWPTAPAARRRSRSSRGCSSPRFGSEALDALGDAGAVTVDGDRARDDHRRVRRQADPLPRRLDRRAGGQRHGQRPRGGRRAAAGADAVARPRGGPRRPRTCAPRSRRSPRRRARPGVRDRRRRHEGRRARPRRRHVRLHDGPRPPSTRARALSPAGAAAGRPRSSSPARSASTARRSCSPAASSSSTPTIESDTRSLWPAVDALLDAAGPGAALHARRDPRRRRLGAQRARARLGRRRCSCARPTCPSTRRSPAPRRSSASTRMYVANEGKLVAFVAPEAADAALAALRAVPGCERGGRDRRGARPSRPGWCWWRPRSAAGG